MKDWEIYNFETLCKEIADKIKEQCKTMMDVPRYKIIVQVTIGQMRDQGIKISSRCLWDTTTDNYATVSFQNQQVFATANVFARNGLIGAATYDNCLKNLLLQK